MLSNPQEILRATAHHEVTRLWNKLPIKDGRLAGSGMLSLERSRALGIWRRNWVMRQRQLRDLARKILADNHNNPVGLDWAILSAEQALTKERTHFQDSSWRNYMARAGTP